MDRISDRSTFSRLRVDSVKGRYGPLGFRYVALPGTDGLGVGYAIGRDVGTAVVRNRLRRQLRAVFSHLATAGPVETSDPQAPQLAPGALLVMVRPGVVRLDFAGLTAAVNHGLSEVISKANR